jgi:hypothetical protein
VPRADWKSDERRFRVTTWHDIGATYPGDRVPYDIIIMYLVIDDETFSR